jgi:hypothetical protein
MKKSQAMLKAVLRVILIRVRTSAIIGKTGKFFIISDPN